MTQLKILMLGQPNILWDDKPISIDRKAIRTLLYFLSSQTKPVGRSTLCEFFWPSPDGNDARRKLRSLLAKLRSSLPDPNYLISANDHVSLDLSKIYVDIHDYLNQYHSLQNMNCQYPEETLLPKPIVDSLLRSESLWRGAHFLESTKLVSSHGLDNWLTFTNETLISARQICLERLANHYVACGEPDTAVKYLLDLLLYDDMNPDLFHKIILALIRGGHRKEAEKVIVHVSERYEHQTGSPLPDQIVKDKELIEKAFNKNRKSSAPSWPGSLSINLPLVGRHKELKTLQLAFQNGGILVLKGEAGSGKTRLIKELYERTWPDVRLLLVNCYEADQNIPMQAIIDMLRSNIYQKEWNELPNLWANFLTLLMPDLTQIKPNLVIPEKPVGSQGEGLIFEAIMNIIRIASESQRILFVLDDAQWADITSLSAIHYLATHGFFKNNGLLLISYREEHINKGLKKMLLSLSRTEEIREVELSGLSEDDVSQIASLLIQTPFEESFLHLLTKETGGNPYLILETIATLQQNNVSGQIDEKPTKLPIARNIQNLVEQRRSHLDSQTQECLMAAAALGFDIDLEVLERVVSLSSRELEKALKNLSVSGFIKSPDDNPGSVNHFQFTYNIERESILSGLNPTAGKVLHFRIGHALETVLQDRAEVQASRIAHHYQLAGRPDLAIKWWLKAAKYAWNLFSKSATDQAYQEVEKAFNQFSDTISEEDAFTYFSQYALYAYESEELEGLDQICRVCLDMGQQRKSPLLIGTAFHYMSYATFLTEHYHEGLGYLEKAVTYLSAAENASSLTDAYIRRGMFFALVQRFDEAIHSYDSALEIINIDGMPKNLEDIFHAHSQKSLSLFTIGLTRKGLAEIEVAYEKYQHILRPFNQLRAQMAFSYNQFKLGLYPESYAHAKEGLRLSKSLGNLTFELYFLLVLARIEIRFGNLDIGIAMARDAIRKAEYTRHVEVFMRAYGIIGEAYLHLEDFNKAEEALRIGTRSHLTSQAYYENLGRLAFALARLDRPDESEAILREVMDHTLQTDLKGIYVEAMLFQSYLLFSRGDINSTYIMIEDLVEKAFSIGMIEVCMLAKQLQLTAAGILGNFEKVDLLQQEISKWSLENNVPWSHLKTIPEWLKYTKKSDREKAEQCAVSRELLKEIDPKAQSEDIKASFENAKKRWAVGL